MVCIWCAYRVQMVCIATSWAIESHLIGTLKPSPSYVPGRGMAGDCGGNAPSMRGEGAWSRRCQGGLRPEWWEQPVSQGGV